MRLGCFATEVGRQLSGPAENIFLLLAMKTTSAEAPESLCEVDLMPWWASPGALTHSPCPWIPILPQAWVPRLCLTRLSPALFTAVPKLLVRFPGLTLDIACYLSFAGSVHCGWNPLWWISLLCSPCSDAMGLCPAGEDTDAVVNLSCGLPTLWNSMPLAAPQQ